MAEPVQSAAPSPVHNGRQLGPWMVGNRFAIRGDVHLHQGMGATNVELAVWRYRGSEPLPRFLDHLKTDAEAWGALRHGNLVRVQDVGRASGELTCFWIQEVTPGDALADRLKAQPILAPNAAMHIALQLGHALTEVHRAGLVHGDLDPANVALMGGNDLVRLGWGGLASRIEGAGMDAGRGSTRSLAEVAPEALRANADRTLEASTDVYALAALLYRMLVGQPPFLARRMGPLPGLEPRDRLPALPPFVPADLESILTRSLRRDFSQRPPLSELLGVLVDVEQRLGPDSLSESSFDMAGPPAASPPPPPPPPDVARTASSRKRDYDSILFNEPRSVHRGVEQPGLPPHVRSVVPTLAHTAPQSAPAVRSPTPPPAPEVEWTPTPARRSRFWTVAALAAIAGLLMLGGMTLAAAFLNPPGRTVVAPAPTTAAAPAPSAAGVATPERAWIVISTAQPGAIVMEDGKNLGRTPLRIPMVGGPADPPRHFVVQREGFQPTQLMQPWSARDVQHTVTLIPSTEATPEDPAEGTAEEAPPAPVPVRPVAPRPRPTAAKAPPAAPEPAPSSAMKFVKEAPKPKPAPPARPAPAPAPVPAPPPRPAPATNGDGDPLPIRDSRGVPEAEGS